MADNVKLWVLIERQHPETIWTWSEPVWHQVSSAIPLDTDEARKGALDAVRERIDVLDHVATSCPNPTKAELDAMSMMARCGESVVTEAKLRDYMRITV